MSAVSFVPFTEAWLTVVQRPTHAHQAAMARVLRELGAETTLVIAHGLASDALYGDFDAIDVVEKVST